MTLTRLTPLRRKRAAPRKRGPNACARPRCRSHREKIMVGDELLCSTHAMEKADELFSLAVRADGECARCGATSGLQCAHVISRRYSGTRYVRTNAMALCVRCHKWQTEHPLEGEDFFREQIGTLVYDELRRLALAFIGPVDYAAIIANGGVA